MRCFPLLGFLVLAPTGAHAQPSIDPAGGVYGAGLVLLAEAPPSVSGAGIRTLGGAWTYSLVGTFVPVGAGLALIITNTSDGAVLAGSLLVLGGALVGPSLGHFYLGDGQRAWIGIGLRTAGVGAGSLVAYLVAQNNPNELFAGLGEFVMIGAATLVAGGVYSFATLDNAARERGVALVPHIRPNGSPALTLTARF